MGQVLAIGIVTECVTSKKNVEKAGISQDELIVEMKRKTHFDPTIYDISETENSYHFQLKTEIIENQLVLFLEKFYPFIYPDKPDYEETLETLRNTAPSEWLAWANRKSAEEFQIDHYGTAEYIYFNKPFSPAITIDSTSIMLSHEGKTMMETFGRQFHFFKYCIQQTFSEFSIAKALRVYISG